MEDLYSLIGSFLENKSGLRGAAPIVERSMIRNDYNIMVGIWKKYPSSTLEGSILKALDMGDIPLMKAYIQELSGFKPVSLDILPNIVQDAEIAKSMIPYLASATTTFGGFNFNFVSSSSFQHLISKFNLVYMPNKVKSMQKWLDEVLSWDVYEENLIMEISTTIIKYGGVPRVSNNIALSILNRSIRDPKYMSPNTFIGLLKQVTSVDGVDVRNIYNGFVQGVIEDDPIRVSDVLPWITVYPISDKGIFLMAFLLRMNAQKVFNKLLPEFQYDNDETSILPLSIIPDIPLNQASIKYISLVIDSIKTKEDMKRAMMNTYKYSIYILIGFIQDKNLRDKFIAESVLHGFEIVAQRYIDGSNIVDILNYINWEEIKNKEHTDESENDIILSDRMKDIIEKSISFYLTPYVQQ